MVILSIAFTYFTAFIDDEHLDKNHYIIKHNSRLLQRLMFFSVFGLIHWLYSIAAGLMFMAIFDQMLNYLRPKPFWFLGNTAKWDIFFSKRRWLYITVKVLALITSLILFLCVGPHFGHVL